MMQLNYKHIIWDWNGTLFDDVDLCVDIMNGMLKKYKLDPMPLERYKNIFTMPVIHYYEILGFDISDESFSVVGKEFIDNYEIRKDEAALYPHAHEVLRSFKEKGVGQSILSGYFQETLDQIIPHYKLDNYFYRLVGLGNVYGGSKIENGKFLINELGFSKGETLLIGDTAHDFEVAEEIGADCMLIAHGHQAKEKLAECNVPVIENLADLLQT